MAAALPTSQQRSFRSAWSHSAASPAQDNCCAQGTLDATAGLCWSTKMVEAVYLSAEKYGHQ